MRFFLEVAYVGTRYHGWQRQPNAHSVQAELENALATLLRQPVETVASGRTDTGVHARQQFVHLDWESDLTESDLVHRLNRLLPPDVAIRSLRRVHAEAHARFDAVARRYEYHLISQKDPFRSGRAAVFSQRLDVAQMNEAAAQLLNHSDFTSFSKVKTDVQHFRCHITQAIWRPEAETLVFHVRADRFLRGMVRLLTATMLKIGRGKLSLSELQQLVAKEGKVAFSAPAHGLFLAKVEYPPDYFTVPDVAFTGF